ncbi:MAG: DegV family protein, partial [Rothia dentocariosa]
MGRIAVVTDSAAAITPEILKERQERGGFAVVPMPVSVQETPARAGIRGTRAETNTRDLTGLTPEEIDEAILMAHVLGNTVHTSGPAPGV